MGLATAMDTLCTQAYGAKKPKLLSIYFQRGLWILSIALIPITIISVFSVQSLHAGTKSVSWAFRHTLDFLPSFSTFRTFEEDAPSHEYHDAHAACCSVSNIFNVALCYYLVSETSLGYIGAAVARSVSCVFMPLCLLVYIKLSNAFEPIWDGWNLAESLKVGRVGLKSEWCAQYVSGWWAFEILGLLAGLYLKPRQRSVRMPSCSTRRL